jgi:N-terminal 7TM region of histidine kinase
MAIVSTPFVDALALTNFILSAGIVITSFSLLAYILVYNLRSSVARGFCALLACVLVVYFGDLLLFSTTNLNTAERWLRFQWVGIAFVPAAYLHFSDALLRTTNVRPAWRRNASRASYLVSAIFLWMAAFSDLVVRDGVLVLHAPRLHSGPLFGLFILYFFVAVGWGLANTAWARKRCLTSTSRRRMTYLAVSFAAPALGIFPYLLVTSQLAPSTPEIFWLVLIVANVGIGAMLVAMAYTVAYFGVLTPDRVVKHRLIHFLVRGPFTASCIAGAVILVARVEEFVGLPRDMLVLVVLVALVVLLQLFVSFVRPYVDLVIFSRDRRELVRIQRLSERLLTTTDLQQFLENILSAICDLLRVPAAFVVASTPNGPQVEAVVGPVERAPMRESLQVSEVGDTASGSLDDSPRVALGYWVWPVRTHNGNGDSILGALAVTARSAQPDLTPDETVGVTALIGQAAKALQDRRLQQQVFAAVDNIMPDLEALQRERSAVRYADSSTRVPLDAELAGSPEFTTWVRDALGHYWGGPKLTSSPLMRLKVVQQAIERNEDSPAKALRAVLLQAMERLKPEGDRKMTAGEWLLFNILELKFIQGQRVREIAWQLALSESDLYRKQRVALEAVSAALADMERQAEKAKTGVAAAR